MFLEGGNELGERFADRFGLIVEVVVRRPVAGLSRRWRGRRFPCHRDKRRKRQPSCRSQPSSAGSSAFLGARARSSVRAANARGGEPPKRRPRLTLLLALSAVWPLPLVNVIPGVIIVLIAIAYLQEDGLLLAVAAAAAFLSLAGFGWTLWTSGGAVMSVDWAFVVDR
jgi:Exopolysaccharide synthesis, ExoD